MNLNDLGLVPVEESRLISVGDKKLQVKSYLPINDKADLIGWVLNIAIDERTGCISPLRLETAFGIAVVQRYAGVEIDSNMAISEVYDLLETNSVIDLVMSQIPKEELDFLSQLVDDTATVIERYNNSFVGVINSASGDTETLMAKINEILGDIKDAKGLELLSEIKNLAGSD